MKIIVLLILIIIGGFAFWYGLKAVLKTEYPLLAVASGSMKPTLNYGDLVIVQGGLNACEIKAAPKPEGDIIVFWKPSDPGTLFVQRAVASVFYEGTLYFATMGDNSNCTDREPVSEKDVVGRVTGKVPLLGYIPLAAQTLFAQTSEGMYVIIILVVIFTLIGRRFFSRKDRLHPG